MVMYRGNEDSHADFTRRRYRHKIKVAEYAKFLEDDYDWDWAYILRLLAFKLKRTSKAIANGYGMDGKKRARQIDKVIALLERIDDNDYHKIAFKEYYKKYGYPRMKSTPCKDSEYSELTFLYKGKPSTKEMDREYRKCIKREDRLIQNDINKAFRIMSKYIRWWWD